MAGFGSGSLAWLTGKPKPEMLGAGLAQMAGSAMNLDKAYKDYLSNNSESGEALMTKEEFKRSLNGNG